MPRVSKKITLEKEELVRAIVKSYRSGAVPEDEIVTIDTDRQLVVWSRSQEIQIQSYDEAIVKFLALK